jgi:hypothetical protein
LLLISITSASPAYGDTASAAGGETVVTDRYSRLSTRDAEAYASYYRRFADSLESDDSDGTLSDCNFRKVAEGASQFLEAVSSLKAAKKSYRLIKETRALLKASRSKRLIMGPGLGYSEGWLPADEVPGKFATAFGGDLSTVEVVDGTRVISYWQQARIATGKGARNSVVRYKRVDTRALYDAIEDKQVGLSDALDDLDVIDLSDWFTGASNKCEVAKTLRGAASALEGASLGTKRVGGYIYFRYTRSKLDRTVLLDQCRVRNYYVITAEKLRRADVRRLTRGEWRPLIDVRDSGECVASGLEEGETVNPPNQRWVPKDAIIQGQIGREYSGSITSGDNYGYYLEVPGFKAGENVSVLLSNDGPASGETCGENSYNTCSIGLYPHTPSGSNLDSSSFFSGSWGEPGDTCEQSGTVDEDGSLWIKIRSRSNLDNATAMRYRLRIATG